MPYKDKRREREYKKMYRGKYKDKIKEYQKVYRSKHKDKVKEYQKGYQKKYYQKNKDKISIKEKRYYQKNKDKIVIREKEYKKKNKDRIKKNRNIYLKKKRKTDINFRILLNLRRRINKVLKHNFKSKKTVELIGCSTEKLKQHLEEQFTFGMNWKNYGFGWHVDHHLPCASFDLSKEEEQMKCFNYLNLQPMWATENIKKGDYKKDEIKKFDEKHTESGQSDIQ